MTALTTTYRITRRIPIEDAGTLLHIDTGTMSSGNLANFVKDRKDYPGITATLAPTYGNPAPDLDPVTGEPLNGNQPEVTSPVTFYLFDHLGNTRVTFRGDASDAISITYAADYYPYGKILREYNCNQNRYLSTHHERDKATGYDNRGARLYDSEIGRFLGVDPMAGSFPGHSPYNYVLGNPVRLIDPDGEAPEDIIVTMRKKGNTTYLDVTVRGKILDLSEGTSSTDINNFKKEINSISYFDGAFGHKMAGDESQQRYEMNINFEFEVIKNLSEASPTDHIIGVVDEIPEQKSSEGDPVGVAWRSENVALVESGTLTKRNGGHELGHLLGLGHPKSLLKKGPLMGYGGGNAVGPRSLSYIGSEILTQGGSTKKVASDKYTFTSLAGAWGKDFDSRSQLKDLIRNTNTESTLR